MDAFRHRRGIAEKFVTTIQGVRMNGAVGAERQKGANFMEIAHTVWQSISSQGLPFTNMRNRLVGARVEGATPPYVL